MNIPNKGLSIIAYFMGFNQYCDMGRMSSFYQTVYNLRCFSWEVQKCFKSTEKVVKNSSPCSNIPNTSNKNQLLQ